MSGAYGTPTGTLSTTNGSTVSQGYLYQGAGSVTIPPDTFNAGTATVTVNYSGDATYLPSSATANVTVVQSQYSLAASAAPAVTAGGTTDSMITISSSTGYTGTISPTCSLTSQPSGAVHLPTCQVENPSVPLDWPFTSASAEVEVYTTAPTGNALMRPKLRRGGSLLDAGEGVLAFVVLLGIPARKRRWRSLIGVIVLLMALGALNACGGGGGSSGNGGGGGNNSQTPGTTAGTYTFTVTGTGNPAVTPVPTTTFTVQVN